MALQIITLLDINQFFVFVFEFVQQSYPNICL